MNIKELYNDYNVPYAEEGHKHVRMGWVNVECPFCTGNPGYHLGYNTYQNYFHCWRCGGKSTVYTLSILLKLPYAEINRLLLQYGGYEAEEKPVKEEKVPFALPSFSEELNAQHKKYLEKRGFDPDHIIQKWGVLGTGPLSKLDGMDFRFRLIIPIEWEGRMVSFTSRDVTGKSKMKYLTCKKKREQIFHKQIMYGKKEQWGDTGIGVEGPTDVWRFGDRSLATFGIEYTHAQLRLITKTFKRFFILFDPDPQALEQAMKMRADLRFRGVEALLVKTECDPGDMEQSEADYLIKQLIK